MIRRFRVNWTLAILGSLFSCWLPQPIQSKLNPSGPTFLIRGFQSEAAVAPGNSGTRILELVRQKRWKEVAELAQKLTLKNSDDPTDFYWLGIARFQLQDPVGSVQALRAAEKRGLNTAVLHEGLGLAYYDLNQFFLFEQQMKKASELDARDPRPPYYLGLYHATIKSDVAGALNFFDMAIRLRPDDPKSLYQKGNCLEQMGRPKEARECYTDAISLVERGREPFGWPFQGMARLLLEENPQEALSFAEKAVEVEPNEYSNHLILAKVYERLGNLPEAIREARAARDQNPTSSTARYALFKLYQRAGDHQASETELKMFEKLKAVYGPE